MKRFPGIAALLLCASALAAQTTHIVGTITGADYAPIQRGQISMQPTDSNGNPLNVNISGGTAVPRAAVCLISGGAISTALNGLACTVIDVTLASPEYFCYRTTIKDTVSGWTAPVIPCLQPSGTTWTFTMPNAPSTALLPTGPPGTPGTPGTPGAAGAGYIAGLSSDGNNGVTVAGTWARRKCRPAARLWLPSGSDTAPSFRLALPSRRFYTRAVPSSSPERMSLKFGMEAAPADGVMPRVRPGCREPGRAKPFR